MEVSVVGEEIRSRPGFAARTFDVLKELRANVELISFGATRINLSFLVEGEHDWTTDRARTDASGVAVPRGTFIRNGTRTVVSWARRP